MINTNVIAFTGKAGSGKGTASQIIMDLTVNSPDNQRKDIHDQTKGIVLPLAGELKRIAKDEFGWNGEKDERGRRLLQVLGTEVGRMYGGEDFWVQKWSDRIEQWYSRLNPYSPKIIICDDCRFDNEAQYMRSIGGTMIKLEGRAYDMGDNNNHASEAGVSDNLIDVVIDNSKNFNLLEQRLKGVLGLLGVEYHDETD